MANETQGQIGSAEAKRAASTAIRALHASAADTDAFLDVIPGGRGQDIAKAIAQAVTQLETRITAGEIETAELIRVVKMGTEAAQAISRNRIQSAKLLLEMRRARAEEARERQASKARAAALAKLQIEIETAAAKLEFRYGKGKQKRGDVLKFFQMVSEARAAVSSDDLAALEEVVASVDTLFEEVAVDAQDEVPAPERPDLPVPSGEGSVSPSGLPSEEDPESFPSEPRSNPGAVH